MHARVTLAGFAAAFALAVICIAAPTPPPQRGPAKMSEARLKGMQDALRDLSDGRLVQKEYPPKPYSPSHPSFIKLLESECGVEWRVINKKREKGLQEEVNGYNDLMRAEIEHRFGREIFQELHDRAVEHRRASAGG